ncbi:RDD family protein [Archangium violaceum]|uniref:RDD family protein n=1 Tax=Archangium violaceum TaxID=83451 RepID=UPI001F28E9F1|nr:RDD family protein [Archangium violaceum]
MSKCLKCGASLPPVGDCPTCAAASQPTARVVPSFLDKELQIDRRRPDRDAAAMAPGPAAAPPGMTARGATTPPGMTPAAGSRQQAPAPAAPRAPGLPVMPPRSQAPAAPMAAAPAPRPQAPAAPVAPAPRAAAPRAPAPAQPAMARPPAAPAPAQAAAPRPPSAPSPTPSFNLPGVAAPAPTPRASTPAFGVPRASAPAGLPVMPPLQQATSGLPEMPVAKTAAPLDLSIEEESFPVDLEESEPAAPPLVAAAPARSPAPAAPKPVVTGAQETEIHARPASLWRRLLALAIDTGAIAGVAALYLMLASSVAGVQAPQTNLSGLDAIVVQIRALQSVLLPGTALLLVLSLVYCAVSAFLWNGRTLGRRLLGLRLVDTHGLAPAPGRAIVRAMLASLSFGLFLAGFWMALFDRRGQTLHDKLTSTYVVQPS